jgi:hypothetical protein
MRRGFEVFKAASPAYPTDLIAVDGEGEVLRVKVLTVRRRADDSIPPRRSQRSSTEGAPSVDVLALVVDGEVHYQPEITDARTASKLRGEAS